MNPVSGVIGEAWKMYRAHARHLITIAFVVYLAAAILDGLISLAGGVLVTFVGFVITLAAGFLVQAALVKAVQDVRDGRTDLSVSETLSAATPSILPVAGAAILAGIAIAIGFILLIVPGLFLITIWAVLVPVIVIERTGTLGAFGRSQELVRGRGWNVFGTLVVVWIIQFVVSIVLGVLLVALPLGLRNGLGTLVAGALVAPFSALVVTLMYYRLIGSPVGGGSPGGGYGAQGGYSGPAGGSYDQPGGYGQPGANSPGGYGPPPSDFPPAGGPPSGGYPPAGGPGGYPPAGGPSGYPPAGGPPGGDYPPAGGPSRGAY